MTGNERACSNSDDKDDNSNKEHDNKDKDDDQVDDNDDNNSDNEDESDDDKDNDNGTFQGGNGSCRAVHLFLLTLTICAHRRKSRRAGMDDTCSLLEGQAPAMMR